MGGHELLTCLYMILQQEFLGDSASCANLGLQFPDNIKAETYGPDSRCVEIGPWTRTEGQNVITSDPLFMSGCYEVYT